MKLKWAFTAISYIPGTTDRGYLAVKHLRVSKALYVLTHFAPDSLSPPALFSYCMTPACPVAVGNHTFHTGIPAYAKRTGFSSDLKPCFCYCAILLTMSIEVWLSLRNTANFQSCEIHDGYMKINKSPTVSNGVGASSFKIWSAYLWCFIFGSLE